MSDTKKPSQAIAFMSGAIAGATEITVTMPLDTIKTQMQLNPRHGLGATVSNVLTQKGPQGFYFGYSAMLSQVAFKAAIRFWAYEQSKNALTNWFHPIEDRNLINAMSGVFAGVVEAAVWVTPTERLKIMRQREINSLNPRFNSLVGSVGIVVKEQGFGSLFVGFPATALRQGMAMGIRFALYDQLKVIIAGADNKPTPYQLLGAGCLTGTVSSLVNQPIDTAKSRLQAQDRGVMLRYSGTVNCISTMVREEGVASLYRGSLPRVARLTIGQGIIFSCYDTIREAITKFAG